MRRLFYRGRFIFIPIAIAACLTLAGFVVMLLWNALMPVIFHLGMITFWQAVGLFILCKLLFGFGKGGPRGGFRGGPPGPWMKFKMEERFRNMTPEERERFKQKWNERCGGFQGKFGHHREFFGRPDWFDEKEDAPKAE
jgi:hypothetical protein